MIKRCKIQVPNGKSPSERSPHPKKTMAFSTSAQNPFLSLKNQPFDYVVAEEEEQEERT